MRRSLAPLCLIAGLVATVPSAAASCLSSADASEAVASRQVVPPGRAIVLARKAVPRADVLRASLCRDRDALIYRITVLGHDGRVQRVTVDAPSGKLTSVH